MGCVEQTRIRIVKETEVHIMGRTTIENRVVCPWGEKVKAEVEGKGICVGIITLSKLRE